ncbi:MAG: hypothetical protein WAV50_02190, partial [Minisyncoccia bacterium]
MTEPLTTTLPFSVRVKAPAKFKIAPEFTVRPAFVFDDPSVTLFPPVVAIMTLSAFAGAAPPTHVVPSVQTPPVAVLVIV